jgi:hypothetical protein
MVGVAVMTSVTGRAIGIAAGLRRRAVAGTMSRVVNVVVRAATVAKSVVFARSAALVSLRVVIAVMVLVTTVAAIVTIDPRVGASTVVANAALRRIAGQIEGRAGGMNRVSMDVTSDRAATSSLLCRRRVAAVRLMRAMAIATSDRLCRQRLVAAMLLRGVTASAASGQPNRPVLLSRRALLSRTTQLRR